MCSHIFHGKWEVDLIPKKHRSMWKQMLPSLSSLIKKHMANLFLVHSTKKKQRQNILTEVPVGVTLPESLFPDDIILSQASNVDDFFSMSDKLSFSSRNLIECPASKPSFFSSCSIMLSNWRISAICKNYTIQYVLQHRWSLMSVHKAVHKAVYKY